MTIFRKKRTSPNSLNLYLIPLLLRLLALCLICGLAAFLWVDGYILPSIFLLLALSILAAVMLAFSRLDKVILRLDDAVEQIWSRTGQINKQPIPQRTAFDHINMLSDKLENILDDYLAAASKKYQDELLFRNMQFSVLQSQINPHFLYNTLESIRGSALCAGAYDIADMMESLSLYFRYSISRTGNFVTVMDEIENIQNYFHIQNYRFGDRFCLNIDIGQALNLDKYLIPKLTLQPLVENSIFHGLEPKSGSGTVYVSCVTTQTHIIIRVSDNGVGLTPEQIETIDQRLRNNNDFLERRSETGGIALCNVNQRIQLLFGSEYGLRITSERGVGTEVKIYIPAITSPPKDLHGKEASADEAQALENA